MIERVGDVIKGTVTAPWLRDKLMSLQHVHPMGEEAARAAVEQDLGRMLTAVSSPRGEQS